jgi:hypothetical protein
MDKDLTTYSVTILHQIGVIESGLIEAKKAERDRLLTEAKGIYYYHVTRVHDFQHERLIHLLVTFFFAGLLLLSAAGGLVALTLATDPSGPALNILSWSLCVILFFTEAFYIRHYFKLENGTQKLYKLTDRLNAILHV